MLPLDTLQLLSTLQLPIRWVDLDAYGHVNNAAYFNYMSEARTLLFAKELGHLHLHFVVAETQCSYKKPLHYPNSVLVEQYVKELGHSYLVFYYAFYLVTAASKVLHAEGTAKIICFDPAKQRIARLPVSIYQKIKLCSAA